MAKEVPTVLTPFEKIAGTHPFQLRVESYYYAIRDTDTHNELRDKAHILLG